MPGFSDQIPSTVCHMMHSKTDMQGRHAREACLLQAQHLAEAAACCHQECQPAEPAGAAAPGPGPAAAPAAAVGSARACDAWRPTRSFPSRSGGGWRSCCAQPAGPPLGKGEGADSAAPSPVPLRAPVRNSRHDEGKGRRGKDKGKKLKHFSDHNRSLCSILLCLVSLSSGTILSKQRVITAVTDVPAGFLLSMYWVCLSLSLVLCANTY